MLIDAVIDRRLLVNWRADPDAVVRLLPAGFTPELRGGAALVGICAVRLSCVRPNGFPAAVGVTSESAAHRIAVRGLEGERAVFVVRRDTSSLLSRVVGGRAFPGVHGPARFRVDEGADRWKVAFATPDGAVELDAVAGPSTGCVFGGLDDASAFFQQAPVGWSRDRRGRIEGVELVTHSWSFEPVVVRTARSWWLDERLPPGTFELDGGYVMRDVPVTWRPRR